eukprot:TRINITY_DN18153_c0_g2_i2.p1 TRINITY_DN18153_c0_g2~~TRINITY_DN18153_c0_g2_i2.p1  ORF type:complete len:148 (-),score=13.32 TRINITY_DN18153_c0_g2_i2:135-557(-)
MIRRPPRSTHCISSAASDVYKRQFFNCATVFSFPCTISPSFTAKLADFCTLNKFRKIFLLVAEGLAWQLLSFSMTLACLEFSVTNKLSLALRLLIVSLACASCLLRLLFSTTTFAMALGSVFSSSFILLNTSFTSGFLLA